MEENMSYFYNPQSDEDFIQIAKDVYGAAVRDNNKKELTELGRTYHLNGEE